MVKWLVEIGQYGSWLVLTVVSVRILLRPRAKQLTREHFWVFVAAAAVGLSILIFFGGPIRHGEPAQVTDTKIGRLLIGIGVLSSAVTAGSLSDLAIHRKGSAQQTPG